MPQRLSTSSPANAGAHVRLPLVRPENSLTVQALTLLALFFVPGLVRAQGQGTMQVAAQVLMVEPSRTALQIATVSLENTHPPTRYSALALIRVDPAAPTSPAGEPARRVRIDFLRN